MQMWFVKDGTEELQQEASIADLEADTDEVSAAYQPVALTGLAPKSEGKSLTERNVHAAFQRGSYTACNSRFSCAELHCSY